MKPSRFYNLLIEKQKQKQTSKFKPTKVLNAVFKSRIEMGRNLQRVHSYIVLFNLQNDTIYYCIEISPIETSCLEVGERLFKTQEVKKKVSGSKQTTSLRKFLILPTVTRSCISSWKWLGRKDRCLPSCLQVMQGAPGRKPEGLSPRLGWVFQ